MTLGKNIQCGNHLPGCNSFHNPHHFRRWSPGGGTNICLPELGSNLHPSKSNCPTMRSSESAPVALSVFSESVFIWLLPFFGRVGWGCRSRIANVRRRIWNIPNVDDPSPRPAIVKPHWASHKVSCAGDSGHVVSLCHRSSAIKGFLMPAAKSLSSPLNGDSQSGIVTILSHQRHQRSTPQPEYPLSVSLHSCPVILPHSHVLRRCTDLTRFVQRGQQYQS